MDYLFLTPELRAAAVDERRKELEVAHFRVSLDKEILVAGGGSDEDVAAASDRLAGIESDVVALEAAAAVVAGE